MEPEQQATAEEPPAPAPARGGFFLRLKGIFKPGKKAAPDKRSLQEVWDRHFLAFSEQDLDKILLDYDEKSVFTTYNQTTGVKNVYEGVEGVRSLFTGMFTAFTDSKDLETLVADVSDEGRTALFVWKIVAAGFQDGTDSFVFGKNNKIHRQHAVIRTG